MKQRSAFEIYLRTGRRLHIREPVETKFNHWHDPDDGRFTFAGQGRLFGGSQAGTGGVAGTLRPSSVMRAMGLPVDDGPQPQRTSPKPQSNTAKPARRPQQEPQGRIKLNPIAGYAETGASSWRAANDRVFIEAAGKFNRGRGLKPGDPRYMDPQLIKAWAMIESGGSKSAFLRDPLQVNNPGDFKEPKPRVTGLIKGQQMTPEASADAALKWLEFKGHPSDGSSKRPAWAGIERALQRYNGRKSLHPSGVPHYQWYAREVLRLYNNASQSRKEVQ